jgi:hypothetical protein
MYNCVLMSLPVKEGIAQAYVEIWKDEDIEAMKQVCWSLLHDTSGSVTKCDFVLMTRLDVPGARAVRKMLPAKIGELFHMWVVPWDSAAERKSKRLHEAGAKRGDTFTMTMDAARKVTLLPVEPD